MEFPSRLFIRLIVAVAAFAMTCESFADAVLNPYTIKSDSGQFELSVDPEAKDGAGPGVHRVTHQGNVTWEAELPFTLWSALVTDLGEVVGYAYQQGYDGRGGGRESLLHIVMIDQAGEITLKHTRPRPGPIALTTPPSPYGPLIERMFFDRQTGIVIFQASDGRNEFQWWRYQLSTHNHLDDVMPDQPKGADMSFHRCIRASMIPDTSLALVHWFLYPQSGRVSVLDMQGKEVWQLDLPDEYAKMGPDWKWWDINENGIMQIATRQRGFEVWSYTDSTKSSYAVSEDDNAPGGWRIEQLDKAAAKPPIDPEFKTEQATINVVDKGALQRVGVIRLGAGDAQPEPLISSIIDFRIDSKGRFGFIRRRVGGDGFAFVLVDSNGDLIKQIDLEPLENSKNSLGVTGNDRWVLLQSQWGENPNTKARWIDPETGTMKEIEGFQCGSPETVKPRSSGGFLVLAKIQVPYSSQDDILCFDAEGKLLWNVRTQGYGQGFIFQDIASTPDGGVAALTAVSNTVELFDAAGKHTKSIALEKTLGQKLNYPAGLMSDGKNGLVLHDFNGDPAIWRLTMDGTARESFQPHFDDGRTFRLVSDAQRGPDNSLWTSDGNALLKLGQDGTVTSILGLSPEEARLDEVSHLCLSDRHIYALDERTKSVHMFDLEGKFVRMLQPEPTDFSGKGSVGPITVSGDGYVYVGYEDGDMFSDTKYLVFDNEGARVGFEDLDIDSVTEDWIFRPGSQVRWVICYEDVALVGPNGEVSRRIKRRPDNKWLDRVDEAAVAPDGSLAVISAPGGWGFDFTGRHLSVYSPTGDGLFTMPLPAQSFCRLAFDGQHVALASEDALTWIDVKTNSVERYLIESEQDEKKEQWWIPLYSPDGEELWLRNANEPALIRFERPMN